MELPSMNPTTEETEWTPHESLIDIDLVTDEIEGPPHQSLIGASNLMGGIDMFISEPDDTLNFEGRSDIILETAGNMFDMFYIFQYRGSIHQFKH